MLEIRGLRFSRPGFSLDLDLELPEGAYGVLLGASGCGKSTALRLVAGLLEPEGGSVRLAGRELLGLAPERRRVGMVFQDYALFPQLSVRRNIEYGPRLRGAASEERRKLSQELGKAFRIEGLLERRPASLSGGEQQRVALARSVAARPELLLLDEPLSSLDTALRRALRGEIRERIRDAGLSALHVTHDLEEALAIADRLFIMDGGRVVEAGDPEAIYARPGSAFAARFLGRGPLIPVTRIIESGPRPLVLTPFGKLRASRGLPTDPAASETESCTSGASGTELPKGSLAEGRPANGSPTGGQCYLHFGAGEARALPGSSAASIAADADGVYNELSGVAGESYFLGTTRRVSLRPPAGGEPIELELGPEIRPSRGEALVLVLPIDSCILLR